MRQIYINGRFLTQPLSGVQRYARQLAKALDQWLEEDAALRDQLGEVKVWYPAGSELTERPDWKHLKLTSLKGLSGHGWEQISLARQARDGFLISPCGSGPLICRHQLLIIHDANIWDFPEAFSKPYRLFHKTMRPLLARRVSHLGTVSQFSAHELSRCLGLKDSRFEVIYNSAEHIMAVEDAPEILQRHGLEPDRYLFAAGNQSPNKNINRLVEALDQMGDRAPTLAVAGGYTSGVSRNTLQQSGKIRLLGRVSDEELKTLYANASAFVWPSLYEGFGIPPLEAMMLGTPVLSSSTTAMPEVLGDAVTYFNPNNVDDIARAIEAFSRLTREDKQRLSQTGREQAQSYSWSRSARQMINLITAQ